MTQMAQMSVLAGSLRVTGYWGPWAGGLGWTEWTGCWVGSGNWLKSLASWSLACRSSVGESRRRAEQGRSWPQVSGSVVLGLLAQLVGRLGHLAHKAATLRSMAEGKNLFF